MKRFMAIDTDFTTYSTQSLVSFTKSTFAESQVEVLFCVESSGLSTIMAKQHRHATVGLATLALVSAFGASSMCLGMPSLLPARWTTVTNL